MLGSSGRSSGEDDSRSASSIDMLDGAPGGGYCPNDLHPESCTLDTEPLADPLTDPDVRLLHARLKAVIAMGADRDCAALLAMLKRDAREADDSEIPNRHLSLVECDQQGIGTDCRRRVDQQLVGLLSPAREPTHHGA